MAVVVEEVVEEAAGSWSVPTTTRTTLAWPGKSLVPAPTPAFMYGGLWGGWVVESLVCVRGRMGM